MCSLPLTEERTTASPLVFFSQQVSNPLRNQLGFRFVYQAKTWGSAMARMKRSLGHWEQPDRPRSRERQYELLGVCLRPTSSGSLAATKTSVGLPVSTWCVVALSTWCLCKVRSIAGK